MRSLCERADIIVPNLTEAALLLGEPYQAGPYTKAYIDGILHKLSQLGPKQVVLTGVYFDEKELGAATFDMERNATEYVLTEENTRLLSWYGRCFRKCFTVRFVK